MVAVTITTPEEQEIRRDLEYMVARWGELPEAAVFEVRAFKEGASPQISKYSPDWIDEAVDWIVDLNEMGYNIYVVRNPIRQDVTGSATDADIIASFFLWADCDDEASAGNVYRFDGPKWTSAVTTGRTPSVRVHTYWELREPCLDMAEWRRMQETIAAHFRSDSSVVNPSRIMRVGGTVSYPAKHKLERGYIKEVTTIRTEYDDGRAPVSMEQMIRVFGAKASTSISSMPPIDTGPQPLDRALAAANILAGSDWRENLKKLVASYVARGWTDSEISDRCSAFTLPGWTPDQTRQDVLGFIKWTREQEAKNGGQYAVSPELKSQSDTSKIIQDFKIKTSDEFLADLEPLEYLIDGILPTGVVYSLTGYPGHGKTTLAIQVGLSVALGGDFVERRVEGGDVLFLAGENPYNLKWQYAAALAARDITTADRLHFVEGHFSISAMIETLKAKMAELPNLKLIIIDSLQAFFEGDDDNANIKMVEAARRFREVGDIGSRPAVLVIAHPAGKEPKRDNLVPRGGGAFLAEIDGNLTVWGHGEDMQTLHHSPKFRGAGFEPIDFVMATHEFSHLTDTNGTPLRLKVSRQAMQIEQATRADRRNSSLRNVLMELSGQPRLSLRELSSRTGIPKSTVSNLINEAKEEKLIRRHAKGWKLTDGGEEYLDV